MNSTFGRDTLLLKHQSQPPKFETERICVNGTESHKWPNLRWTLNSRSGAHAAISLTPRDTSRHRGFGCGAQSFRTLRRLREKSILPQNTGGKTPATRLPVSSESSKCVWHPERSRPHEKLHSETRSKDSRSGV